MHRTNGQSKLIERINGLKKGDELVIMIKEWEKVFKTYLPSFLHNSYKREKHLLYKKKYIARVIDKKYYILRVK